MQQQQQGSIDIPLTEEKKNIDEIAKHDGESKSDYKYKPLDFQEVSITKMFNCAKDKIMPAGHLLADEMGLGKTSQMLELLRRLIVSLNARNESKVINSLTDGFEYLIIVPKSLLGVWVDQAKMVSQNLLSPNIYVCHSKLNNLEQTMLNQGYNLDDRESLPRILLTKPNIIRQYGWEYVKSVRRSTKDTKDNKNVKLNTAATATSSTTIPWFYKKNWRGVIVDEAHEYLATGVRITKNEKFVNNWTVKIPHCIKQFNYQWGWALTGTPFRNATSDIVSIAQFILKPTQHPCKDLKAWNMSMKSCLDTFFKKFAIRNNDAILGLPPLERHSIECEMSKLQVKNALQDMHACLKLLKKMEKSGGVAPGDYMAILKMIDRMRKNNTSPYLINNPTKNEDKLDAKDTKNAKIEDSDSDNNDDDDVKDSDEEEEIKNSKTRAKSWYSVKPEIILQDSPKLAKIIDLLDTLLKQDQQVLIFSFSVETLNLLSHLLTSQINSRQVLEQNPLLFYGQSSLEEREVMINLFQSGVERVMLISAKAGGLGITLTAATHVIIVDPWWHPFFELQAAKRAHRKGQTKTCHMWRTIMDQNDESIDKWILGLQKAKLDNASSMIKDFSRYSDCFMVKGNNMDLVESFRLWINKFCGRYNEENMTTREIKTQARKKTQHKREDSNGDLSDDDVDINANNNINNKLNASNKQTILTTSNVNFNLNFIKEWSCKFCTFINHADLSRCEMCENNK